MNWWTKTGLPSVSSRGRISVLLNWLAFQISWKPNMRGFFGRKTFFAAMYSALNIATQNYFPHCVFSQLSWFTRFEWLVVVEIQVTKWIYIVKLIGIPIAGGQSMCGQSVFPSRFSKMMNGTFPWCSFALLFRRNKIFRVRLFCLDVGGGNNSHTTMHCYRIVLFEKVFPHAA